MSHIKKIRIRRLCVPVQLKKGVILITTFSLLNKLSGFFGIPTIFYGGDIASIISFLYSIFATAAFAYFLYFGVLREDSKILYFYSIFYWIDLIINILFTLTFEILWYIVMDHTPLPPSGHDNNNNNNSNNTISSDGTLPSLPAWKVESSIANLILSAVTVVHIYFGFVVHVYARSTEKRSVGGFALLKSESDDNSFISTSRYTTVDDDLELQI